MFCFSGTGAPGSSGQDTDVDDTPSPNLSSLQTAGIAVGIPFGVILVVGVVLVFLPERRAHHDARTARTARHPLRERRAHHDARTARTARHPSPSAPRQELAEVENDYTCPPPTNPRFVQVNEA